MKHRIDLIKKTLKNGVIFFILCLTIPQWGYSIEDSSIPSNQQTDLSKISQRDPTEPSNMRSNGKNIKTGKLQLRSILIGNTRRLALINDTFVHVGDTIGMAQVIAIHDDSVILMDSGQTLTLYLFENDIRK